jgi:predicted dehydrogenase
MQSGSTRRRFFSPSAMPIPGSSNPSNSNDTQPSNPAWTSSWRHGPTGTSPWRGWLPGGGFRHGCGTNPRPGRVRPILKYLGQHFGTSWIEHQKFAHALRNGLPPEIPLEEGLRAVATGLAAHKSIDEGRVVALSEVLPTGW